MAKQIRYSEPTGYFPKEIRDRFKETTKKSTSKNSGKKTTAKKKSGK